MEKKEANGQQEAAPKPNGAALIPLLIFIAIYLGAGIILQAQGVPQAFYQFPPPVAMLFGVLSAFFLIRGSYNEKLKTFIKGAGEENIVIMIIIFMLANAFSVVGAQMGAVDSLVNLGLSLVPPQFFAAGFFVISCILSISIGTSLGTVMAVGPIAVAISHAAGLNMSLVMASVVSGGLFGDNLSVISDTTIAVTRGLGVEMQDKFKNNFLVALPAALLTVVILLFVGQPEVVITPEIGEFNFILVIPYIVVLVTAIAGLNVFIALTIGIFLAGGIGLALGMFDMGALSFAQAIQQGFLGMSNVIFITILLGGLAAVMRQAGGLEFIIGKIRKRIKGQKSAELGIAALALSVNAATAHNTISLITTGPIIKKMCSEYKLDPRRAASVADIFVCVIQGIVPYGVNLLAAMALAGGYATVIEMIPMLYYQYLLGLLGLLSIFVPFANGQIRRNPWNFEKWTDAKNVQRMEARIKPEDKNF